jgi:hypothetical protein
MHAYVVMYGHSGAFALEQGGRQKRLHCQGVMQVRMLATEEGVYSWMLHGGLKIVMLTNRDQDTEMIRMA